MEAREFTLGVLWAALVMLDRGEDTFAAEIIETLALPVSTVRRLARREDYQFKRGFWAELQHRRECRLSGPSGVGGSRDTRQP